jgi:putative membrane protein
MHLSPRLAALVAAAAFALPGHAQPGPSDAQIAHIVVTANQVDIDAGKLAQQKASSQEVRQFGQQMVTDHTAVNQQAAALARKLNLTPQANDTSASLKKGGDEQMAKLGKLDGKAFDKAYVDNEVTYHQAVIAAVDKTLLPSAKNAELKALIQKVRPALVQHLDHARHLQSKLGS